MAAIGVGGTLNSLPDLIVLGGGTLSYASHVDAALGSAQACSFPVLWQCSRITRFATRRATAGARRNDSSGR